MVCWSSWHYCGVWMVWTTVPCFTSDWFLARVVVVRVCRHVSKAELKRRVDAVCFRLFLSMNAESILWLTIEWNLGLPAYQLSECQRRLAKVKLKPDHDARSQAGMAMIIRTGYLVGSVLGSCLATNGGLQCNLAWLGHRDVSNWRKTLSLYHWRGLQLERRKREREGHVRSCSHAYPLYSSLLLMMFTVDRHDLTWRFGEDAVNPPTFLQPQPLYNYWLSKHDCQRPIIPKPRNNAQ